MEFKHKSVLLDECLEGLAIRGDGVYMDGTLGGGGHSSEIIRRLVSGRLIGIDRDMDAIHAASARIKKITDETGGTFDALHGNFHDAPELLASIGVEKISGALLDLGVSSYQLDEGARGFSYHADAPLDMRMDRSQGITARDIVNEWSDKEIARILRDYGEENWAVQIARVLCDRRKKQPIETTGQLVDIIDAAIPKKVRQQGDGAHPARRTFQALRIAVNDELAPLEQALRDISGLLEPGGRLCVIAFHSLEDRVVKNTFKNLADPCTCPKSFPVCVCGKKPTVKLITRKPITASEEELKENPRARSATLRIVEKL
ncbi:MAG: 16S rRNA (cytosine(1402)-N(4))-methyltransferase RsmH [Clostridia bacterium]|nr:16S rRNA (cytosine(1402)-N(4))-methyltransferase RsmH [Clostridia bacterium]